LDEENPTNASLAQENGFGSTYLDRVMWLVKGAAAAAAAAVHLQKRV
jgi:2-methylcitrate dehydratase PrpD